LVSKYSTVGIEGAEDLIEDMEQALTEVK